MSHSLAPPLLSLKNQPIILLDGLSAHCRPSMQKIYKIDSFHRLDQYTSQVVYYNHKDSFGR